MKLKNRLKSYSFWLGIISAILLVVKSLFKIDINMEYANETITAILGALVVAGIISYPTEKIDNDTDLDDNNSTDNNNTDNNTTDKT